jgi:hypothetical protein
MNVKLTPAGGMAGTGFEFKPGMTIKCSERQGQRLIEHGIGTEAPKDAQVDGELFDKPPEELLPPPKKGKVERAIKPPAEKPEADNDSATCAGSTAKGNRCLRAPVAGKKFCQAHLEE